MKIRGKLVLVTGVVLVIAFGAGVFLTSVLKAQSVPQLINYQGRLADDTGLPIDGPRQMHFSLLDADTSTAIVLWGETHSSVQVNDGIYHVILGSVEPIPPSALSGSTAFLEVEVEGELLLPRQRITSAPYAVNAGSLGGTPRSDFYTKAEVDALISGLQSQVTTNETNITTNTSSISSLDTRVTTNETDISTNIQKLEPVSVSLSGSTVTDFIFDSVNVHVRSGSGATDGAINGLGNLIVGYDEDNGDDKSGSHNIVVGRQHTYSSYGGLVAGQNNSITAQYASVTGGSANTASGGFSSVSAGRDNIASGSRASVSGGQNNTASGLYSSISGGRNIIVSSDYDWAGGHLLDSGTTSVFTGVNVFVRSGSGATDGAVNGLGNLIIGYNENFFGHDRSGSHNLMVGLWNGYSSFGGIVSGAQNQLEAPYSYILGGGGNITQGPLSNVVGGKSNRTTGTSSSIIGGYDNTASGDYSTVTGGRQNTASGESSHVSGGYNNRAYSYYSSVLGGRGNEGGDVASGDPMIGLYSAVCGGRYNIAKGEISSISGGYQNTADGLYSSVSGGQNITVSSDYGWDADSVMSTLGQHETKLSSVSVSGDDFIFSGVNVHLRSGAGSTDASVNGLGNLIVGYNENENGYSRNGSHNLVVGLNHGYDSYAAIIGGLANRSTAPYASLTGGRNNQATGQGASVSGGRFNIASGLYSSVTGGGGSSSGDGNESFANYSAILGGATNLTGDATKTDNTIGVQSTISGGVANMAYGTRSTVSGGNSNEAGGGSSSVSGGLNRNVTGQYDWAGGGLFEEQ